MNWILRIFSIFIFICGLGFVMYSEFNHWVEATDPIYNPQPVADLPDEANRFLLAWAEDVRYLIQTEQLPKNWNDLKEVKFFFESDEMEAWEKKFTAPIPTKSDGKYWVEVLIVPWNIGKVEAVLVQYDVYEVKSRNLQWEIARNIYLVGNEDDIPDDLK